VGITCDGCRRSPPPSGPGRSSGSAPGSSGQRSSWAFIALNADKRSIALDLKHPDGAEALRALAAEADVLVESFRPGVMARLGLGSEVLTALNPRLVHCAITGYGQRGPLAQAPGHDLNYLARSGVLGLAGPADGPPAPPPVQVADLSAALWAVVAILAALEGRRHSGLGRFIDLDMTAAASSLLMMTLAPWLNGAGPPPARGGDVLTGGATCYRAYVCRDGRVFTLAALEPRFWAAFCARVDRPAWRPRQFDPVLGAEVAALFLTRDAADWTALLSGTEACAEPALELAAWRDDPQTQAARLFMTGTDGTVHLRTPARDPDGPPPGPAPALGEHTHEVLAALGWGADRIAGLTRATEAHP
jgi:alpha-methylacyl-CoA racemase